MTISPDDGLLERLLARFRDQADVVRKKANHQFFLLLSIAQLSVCFVYVVMILLKSAGSMLLWPILAALMAGLALSLRTRRTRRYASAMLWLAVMMLVGICGVILAQRGSNAAAVIYGLTTVAVVLIAGFVRIGSLLGAWLAVWTAAVSLATSVGFLSNAAASRRA